MSAVDVMSGRDDGDPRHPKIPVDLVAEHPAAAYSGKPKGPLNYVLVYDHPCSLERVFNDNRTRSGTDWQEHFEGFVENVRQFGVLVPIIAVREGEVKRIVDGQTRADAAMLAGLDLVPILLYECQSTGKPAGHCEAGRQTLNAVATLIWNWLRSTWN